MKDNIIEGQKKATGTNRQMQGFCWWLLNWSSSRPLHWTNTFAKLEIVAVRQIGPPHALVLERRSLISMKSPLSWV